MKIVVDAMGGDYAPAEIVKGALNAAREYGVEIILVGNEDAVKKELDKYPGNKSGITVVHAPEVIEMGEHPAVAIRKKKQSSIVVGIQLVKNREGDAIVSAGSTGAAMAASLLGLGRIKGIDRPAIAAVLPNLKGYTLVLDVGANVDSKPQNLLQFAIMGSIYAEKILKISRPRVGLLNIGEEETKGNELTLATYELLKNTGLNFIGNSEGRDITKGTVDVVVCDGFVGNVVLKFGEGLVFDLFTMVKEEIKKSIIAQFAASLLFGQAKNLKKRLDYTEYGGAPLLGVNGVSIITHGSSRAKAVKNSIRVAKECVELGVVPCIRESLKLIDLAEAENIAVGDE